MDTLNNSEMHLATCYVIDYGCSDCEAWCAENLNNPEGAVRECSCKQGRMTILPTCKKCGNAPCGCTSEERYGYPVSPENDLQVQTKGNSKLGLKPNWAIKAEAEQLETELTVVTMIQKIFGWGKREKN